MDQKEERGEKAKNSVTAKEAQMMYGLGLLVFGVVIVLVPFICVEICEGVRQKILIPRAKAKEEKRQIEKRGLGRNSR